MYYNKLIRDRLPARIEEGGDAYEIRPVADANEFQQELLKKVREEADALSRARTREEFIDEYADLMVVLDTLTSALELSEAEVATALQENLAAKGGFQQRHFLQWAEQGSYESNESPQGVA